jgi:hypothetical protein
MNDIALHPRFAENRWIYFTYYKPVAGSTGNARATLARARFDGGYTLSDVRDIFSTDSVVGGPSAAEIVFGRDGKIYMTIGIPIPRPANDTVAVAQEDGRIFPTVTKSYMPGRQTETAPDGSLSPVLVVRFPIPVEDREEWSKQCKAWQRPPSTIQLPDTGTDPPP